MGKSKKKNILFMTARLPFPIIGGDRLKPNYLLRHLAKNHNVTLVSFYQGRNVPDEYKKHFEDMGIELKIVELSPLKTAFKILPKVFTKPLEILYYWDNKFQDIVNEILEKDDIDLSFAFFMRTAEYIKDKEIAKVLIAEDCRTIYQKRSFKESSSLKQKLIRWWEWKILARYEPIIFDYFDRVTFVSEEDINHSTKINNKPEYRLLTNGTDINRFIASDNQNRKDILFAGKLDVWANELMVKRIIEDILPIIKKQYPEVKFNIVGANATSGIKSLLQDDVVLHENVPEMIPYLQNAALFLHPHAGGSGIQNKLLEAMACECPVVTTPTGNQGIHGTDNKEIMIGKNAQELAEKSIEILGDLAKAEIIGKNARKLIVETHSWERVYKSLDELIEEVLEEK